MLFTYKRASTHLCLLGVSGVFSTSCFCPATALAILAFCLWASSSNPRKLGGQKLSFPSSCGYLDRRRSLYFVHKHLGSIVPFGTNPNFSPPFNFSSSCSCRICVSWRKHHGVFRGKRINRSRACNMLISIFSQTCRFGECRRVLGLGEVEKAITAASVDVLYAHCGPGKMSVADGRRLVACITADACERF